MKKKKTIFRRYLAIWLIETMKPIKLRDCKMELKNYKFAMLATMKEFLSKMPVMQCEEKH